MRRHDVTPILILTARDDVATKVELLNAGADDYLAKPFHVEELLARVGVQLRKQHVGAPKEIGDLTIDPVRRQVWWAGAEVRLSPREFALLAFMAGAARAACTAASRSSGTCGARTCRPPRTSSTCTSPTSAASCATPAASG